MGEEEFEIVDGGEDDDVIRSEAEKPNGVSSAAKRRLVEAKLAQRNLEKLIQDYDFDLA
jgi:hypothetical protein